MVLLGTAVALLTSDGSKGILNSGPHGFSEVLYAFTRRAITTAALSPDYGANTPL